MAVSKTRRTRILGAATAFIGVGAAGLVMAAPASAAVTGVEITTPSGYGSSQGVYGSGCEYDIEATVDNASKSDPVRFYLQKGTGPIVAAGSAITPTGNTATYSWTPGDGPTDATGVGSYKIWATQGAAPTASTPADETATVATGFQPLAPSAGSVDIELPFTDACIVTG